MAGSTRLAIGAENSPVFDVEVAAPPADDPCDSPTAAPAPTPAATIAVAVSPSIVRPWCRLGGSGGGYCPYCPYGYCAHGSLMVLPPRILFAALLLATQEESPANLGKFRRDDQPYLLFP